jgi:hypothetical protein
MVKLMVEGQYSTKQTCEASGAGCEHRVSDSCQALEAVIFGRKGRLRYLEHRALPAYRQISTFKPMFVTLKKCSKRWGFKIS